MLVARDVEVRIDHDAQILASVSLEVAPGTLVALMGASGSGKSTLIRVLAGIEQPSAGIAVWAGEPTPSVVHALGYVPQRESVHDRLTAREAFHYAASLRLPSDADIAARVDRVLDELDLVLQADTLIRSLSGGERRRAACGLELVGDPPVLLLDEPTSGLDAVLELRLMQLFRRLADHGRAVLVATHATASLDMCDEVAILQKGKPAYRGDPSGARAHLATVAKDPAADEAAPVGDQAGARAAQTRTASPLKVAAPVAPGRAAPASALGAPPRLTRPFLLELRVLTARYMQTLVRDRRTLVVLLLQAPLIGLLIAVVFHAGGLSPDASPIDAIELVFLLMTGAIWLGVASACREIVKERGLVEREFDVGIRLDAYVLAKALVLFALNFVQVLLLSLVVEGLRPLGIGASGVVQVFVIALLTAWASTAMGLAVSCAARSVDQAAGAVPLLLMPQFLLAGALIPLAQMPTVLARIADVVYARWSFAGLGSAARIAERLAGNDNSSILGFDNGFFSVRPAVVLGILIAFTLVELLGSVLLLMRRPPVNP